MLYFSRGLTNLKNVNNCIRGWFSFMKSAFTSSENVIKLNALKKNSDGFVCGFKAYTALKSHIYK